jgi:hypothetical protein
MKPAIPRYFRRAEGPWHRTWSPDGAPLLITTCGLSVKAVSVTWSGVCEDGLPVLPRFNLCPRCFAFLFGAVDNCAPDAGPPQS